MAFLTCKEARTRLTRAAGRREALRQTQAHGPTAENTLRNKEDFSMHGMTHSPTKMVQEKKKKKEKYCFIGSIFYLQRQLTQYQTSPFCRTVSRETSHAIPRRLNAGQGSRRGWGALCTGSHIPSALHSNVQMLQIWLSGFRFCDLKNK